MSNATTGINSQYYAQGPHPNDSANDGKEPATSPIY